MHSVSNSIFRYLNWNPNKEFKVLDSTERKILSFLRNSVVPTCFFYRGHSLSTYPLLDKEFKPLFIANIDNEFKKHIAECPVEDYRETLSALYIDLRQQIGDLAMDSTVSKENVRLSLQNILVDCFRKLFCKPPLNMPCMLPLRDLPDENKMYLKALRQGQCHHYAFCLAKEYKVLMSMIPFESPCNVAFILYPKFFIQGLGYSETDTPTKGDLVLYLGDPKLHNNNCRFKHLGIMTERSTVKSYWVDFSCQLEHEVFQVPDAFGFDVIFFHKETLEQSSNLDDILVTTNRMSDLIAQFDSQYYIPSPLTTLGALLFLLDKLKSACIKSHPVSQQWDWPKMQKSLLVEFPLNMKHVELLKEFQFRMQEILPEYFRKLA